MIPMTTDHTFTLGQAAATGRSKSTISKALKTGTLSYRDRTKSGLDAAFDRPFTGCRRATVMASATGGNSAT